ncbi:MAG: HIT family protein [Candidatus Peribacteria bacterium]|nr:MAG: HIT family protein [Candidatus Peribacteria bacterium]
MPSIFTKIINREIPAEIIYEDDEVIAFLDINPVRKGHVLLVPKEESRRLHDVEPALAAILMITTQELMLHMKEVL